MAKDNRNKLDNVPEDVQLLISKEVVFWSEKGKQNEDWMDRDEMEKQRKLRDFVLYGLVLTAKSTCQAFLPILIRSVTLGSDHHLGEFYQLLQKRPDLALQVKEFRLIHSKKLWESEGVVDQNKMGEQNMKELQLLNVLQLDLLFFINWHSNALLITLEQKSDLSALIRDGWVWSEVSFLLSFPI